jgi:hypothetical protein
MQSELVKTSRLLEVDLDYIESKTERLERGERKDLSKQR